MLRPRICVTLLIALAVYADAAEEALRDNLALGKPYTLSPDPNYHLCTDPDDATQLTDGVFTKGHFWTTKTTVGWSGGATKFITVDLGEAFPLAGVAYSTAAGIADVGWPVDLWVFVSDDKETWHYAGDLLDLSAENGLPPEQGYATHVYRTTKMRTHGRYVQFVVTPDLNYLFADEVEVYRGEDAWLAEPYKTEALASAEDFVATQKFNSLIKRQLRRDLDAVREDVASPGLTDAQKQGFAKQVDAMAKRVNDMPTVPREGFRAVLPMTHLEREVFRLQAAIWRAQGKSPLRLWKNHRWDPLPPSAEPTDDAEPVLEIHMMNGEHRADVLNLTNAGEADLTIRFRAEGLPGGTNPEYLHAHEVLCVGTRRFVAVSSALPLAKREGDDFLLTVPSGMTRQIWLGLHPTDLDPGDHVGRVVLADSAGGRHSVELRLHIHPLRFPDSTSLLLGGWSYTDGAGGRGVNPQNRDAFITHLREHFVNTPWASSGSMPLGQYDERGNLTTEPDTTRFDEWVGKWPDAKCYMVFNAFGDWGNTGTTFAGTQFGTELFDTKVANWIRFWAQHMRDLGLSPKQLGLLLFDEPHSQEQYDVIEAFAKTINRAEPAVALWVDPQPRDAKSSLGMFAQMDVLVPYRKQWLRSDEWFHQLFFDQQKQGRELGFYSCDGPARRFDPFSYYLLQEWHCFGIGGKWAQFWAFGDTSGADVWNEYATDGRGPYTPLYLDDTGVTASKYMEAIREGAQDYEYLVMLRDAVEKAGADNAPAVARARNLLETACDRVLAGEEQDNYTWDQEKDRGVVDEVRVEILEALAALKG